MVTLPKKTSSSQNPVFYDDEINRMIRSILAKCGIEKGGAHALRHTFSSQLFTKGVSTKIVSELLGHSDVSFTSNTYIHLWKDQKTDAVNLLDD